MQPSPSRSTPTDTSATRCLKTRQTRWRNSSARCKKRRLTRIAVFRGYGKESVCGYGVGIQQHKKSRNPCISKDFGSWSIADSKRRTHLPPHPNQYHMVTHWNQNQHLQLNKSHGIPLRCGYNCGYASWCSSKGHKCNLHYTVHLSKISFCNWLLFRAFPINIAT